MMIALAYTIGFASGIVIGYLFRLVQPCADCEELIDALDETVAVVEAETRLVRPELRACLCAAKETLERVAG